MAADRPEIALSERLSTDLRSTSSVIGAWWVVFAASALFVVSGHVLIKAGLNHLTSLSPTVGFASRMLHVLLQPGVCGGLAIYLLGTVCWMGAVSQKEISFLYPLTSVNYVLVAIASALFFQEVISFRRAAGILLIMLGVILMNRETKPQRV
jgi:drug/metabolite transporter (DMT)-like permease